MCDHYICMHKGLKWMHVYSTCNKVIIHTETRDLCVCARACMCACMYAHVCTCVNACVCMHELVRVCVYTETKILQHKEYEHKRN